MSRGQRLAFAVLFPVVIVSALLIGRMLRPESSATDVQIELAEDATVFEHDYVIPAGTADRITDGDEVEIVPRELVVKVGEAIRIVNDDDEGHVVGVFSVGAGETLTQRFTAAGDLSGQCSVHPSGEFTLRVEA